MIYRYFEASTTGDRFTPQMVGKLMPCGDGKQPTLKLFVAGLKLSFKRSTTLFPHSLLPSPQGILLALFHPHIQKKGAKSQPLSVK